MKKLALGLICALPIVLLARVAYLLLFASSPDPEVLDHTYRQAAYTITWAIQLGYVAWLWLKWRGQKSGEAQADGERSGLR